MGRTRGAESRTRRWMMWSIAMLPPAFLVGSLWLSQTHRDGFIMLFDDDGLVESTQALLFAAGAWLSAALSRRLWRSGSRPWAVVYGVLGVALFWVAGEEISWGQRMLGVATPAWMLEHNVQREMTLHNLPGVTETIKDVLYAGLPVVALLSAVLWGLGRGRVSRWRLALWVPHPVLIPTWLGVVSYRWLRRWYYPGDRFVPFEFKRLAEASELLFACGVVVFLVMALRFLRGYPRAGAA